MSDLQSFAALVRKLREAQKNFFREKDKDRRLPFLLESKEMERQVDKRCAEILDARQEEMKL